MGRAARGSGRRRQAPMSGTPIVNEIRRLRFEHGEMTQEALAQACGVTRQTIIALEAGRYAPSLELAFRIARAFGVGLEGVRSEEHTSELQPLMRISYARFCLKKKKTKSNIED